ncbi:hypothetical protein SDC9_133210 [bioreactor metagenome]|uniref:Uncharacterized protein n=1 Tax=bioreactor metagenome TaxID=1076179 RepID=A0A645DAB4_9ZZZZ
MALWVLLLVGQGVGPGGVDGARGMVGRGVDGIELERAGAGIYEVVPGARGDEDGASVAYAGLIGHPLRACAHTHDAAALLDAEKLVGIPVVFQADFSPGRDAHKSQLEVFPGPQRRPEVPVVLGGRADVSHKGIRPEVGVASAGLIRGITAHILAPFIGCCSTLCAESAAYGMPANERKVTV